MFIEDTGCICRDCLLVSFVVSFFFTDYESFLYMKDLHSCHSGQNICSVSHLLQFLL